MPRWPHPTIGYHGGEKGAQVVVMSTGDDQGRERDVRERIVSLMQSIRKGPRKLPLQR